MREFGRVISIRSREITTQQDRSYGTMSAGSEARTFRKEFRMNRSAKLALFEETILPHLNAAYNLARWLTRNEDDAQDVVQEAYLRAFRFFDGFRGGDGKAWLLAVVRNTCLTWRRREKGNLTAVPFDETAHAADRAANAEA